MTSRRIMGPDIALSRYWAEQVGAVDKECYRNALNTTLALPPCLQKQAVYVEGWSVGYLGMLMQHGWVELGDGRIIDPTPSWVKEDDVSRPYFAGRRYTVADIAQRIHAGARSLPLDQVLACECVPPDCVELYGEAYAEAYGPHAWAMLHTHFTQEKAS